MHTFKIWAPRVRTASVKIGKSLYPLQPASGGWWEATVENASPGADYSYQLDGDSLALPDPRSQWQPYGVHGPSRLLDQEAFSWTDREWQAPPFPSAVVYELHIGTFTPAGTFAAAQEHLAYLKDLGITHVELLPVAAFPGKHGWGYDGVDLFAPHAPYGDPDSLKAFVDSCHAHGLAVLLDVVYNHLGPSGNYTGKFGPYFTTGHHTPWGDAVNFEDAGSDEVRRFFIDNTLMWLRDYHFDGLRLDAVHAYMDRSAIHFMEQLACEVRTLEAQTGHSYVLIAESDLNDPRFVTPQAAGGYGFDAQWSDDFHHALSAVITGNHEGYYSDFGTIADLAKSLKDVFVYDGRYSAYRDRSQGRPVLNLPAWKFLGYSQNHDQVGNRARGERLAHLTSVGRTKIAAAIVLTAPFVPMLFQGEEWAASSPFQYFTDHEDKELGRMVSEGRKREFVAFGWNLDEIPDPQAPETFEVSRLHWEEIEQPDHAAMLDWYKKLIHLRHVTPDLTNDSLKEVKVRFSEEEKWLTMERGHTFVAVNLAEKAIQLPVATGVRVLLQSDPGIAVLGETVSLPPDSIAILTTVA